MRQKPERRKSRGEKVVKDIRRATRKQYSGEEKVGIVPNGLKAAHNEPYRAIGPSVNGECRAVSP